MIIWLSSYPRSGNTFLRTLIKNCLGYDTYSIYNDSEIGNDPGLAQITGHRPLAHRVGSSGFTLSSQRETNDIVFVKTHEISRSLVGKGDKVIYIIRDGRQATLSFHKYLKEFYNKNVSPLELSLGFEFPGGSWGDHVMGWDPKNHNDTYLLHFEKLITNPKEAINQVAAHFNIKLQNYTVPEFEELQKINSRFFKQGKLNSYKQELSDTEQVIFWLRNLKVMQEFGYIEYQPPFVNELDPGSLNLASEGLSKGLSYIHQKMVALKNNHAVKTATNQELIDLQKRTDREKEKLLTDYRKQIHDNEGLINDYLKQIHEKDEVIVAQQNEIHSLKNQIEQHNKQIDAIQQSWSWKLTRPMRRATLFFKG